MLFSVQIKDNDYQCELKSNDSKFYLCLSLPECSPISFENGFKFILANPKYLHYMQELASCINELPGCEFQRSATHLALTQAVCGLLKALEAWPGEADWKGELIEKAHSYLGSNSTLNFQACLNHQEYIFGLIIDEESYLIPYNYEAEDLRNCIYPEDWDDWKEKKAISPALFSTVLNNIETLSEIVDHQSHLLNDADRVFFIHSYGSLCKCMAGYLDETTDSALVSIRHKVIPHLCAVVILDEYEDPEEQKQYLERIFNNRRLSADQQLELLFDITADLLEDANRQPELLPRLTYILSSISQYYLSQYDLEHAANFWNKFIQKKDLPLRGLLSLYHRPLAFAGAALGLTLISILPSLYSTPAAYQLVAAASVSAIFALFILVFPTLFSGWVIYRFISGRGLDYIELFLPRLVGAAVVGLSILAFQNTAWDIGEHLPLFDWLLILIGTLVASFLYIFFDVHKTTRLLPLPAPLPAVKKPDKEILTLPARLYYAIRTRLTVFFKGGETGKTSLVPPNPLLRSIKTSQKVFFIGTFEAFVITLLASTLLASAADPTLPELAPVLLWKLGNFLSLNLLYDKANAFLGFQWQILLTGGPTAIFTFLPRLVLLWTGLILLIGSFAQLIWQDRQITSS
jgi:hypothetical protein